MEEKIIESLEENLRLGRRLKELTPIIVRAAAMLIECLQTGGQVLICGNGGSAADAQHIAAELVGRFRRERKGLAAVALTTDTSVLTALANDYTYDQVFRRQVEALGRPGDLLLAISTSGNSPNLLLAAREAKAAGMATCALLGKDGGRLAGEVDLALVVPADDTARIQEGQTVIYHIICDLVEEAFAG
jgi:D-sedoheptulose 7-phosphate isomerase